MSITVLTYHDQTLVDQVNTLAAERAAAARAAESSKLNVSGDFSSVLSDASSSYTANQSTSLSECPTDLYAIFEEAASTYGVSVNLLTSIARAESNFRTDAVSNAGAVGIMQLMPSTAASLGVTNSYDARENIMGGAKLISQLLSKYNGNTSLALAAYNAGSGNVDKYGGIPPFTETQNYVKKVLSYLNTENRSDLKDALSNVISSRNITADTLDELVDLLKSIKSNQTSTVATEASTSTKTTASPSTITVTVINGTDSTAEESTEEFTDTSAADVSTEATALSTEEVAEEAVIPSAGEVSENVPSEEVASAEVTNDTL